MQCDVDKLDESKPRFFGPAGSQIELAVAHALCAWTVLLCMTAVCTVCNKNHRIKRVVSATGRILAWCRAWMFGKVTQSAEERKVQDLVDKRRLERAHDLIYWVLLMSCGTCLVNVVQSWPVFLSGSAAEKDVISLFLYRGDIVLNIYLSMSFLVFIHRPEWVSFRTLDCCHIGVHAIFIFRAALMPAAYSDGFAGVWGSFPRIISSFTYGNAGLGSLLLSVTCMTEIFFKVRLDASQDASSSLYVRMQLMILLTNIVMLWSSHAATRAEATVSIQAKRSQGVEKLVLRVLWGMCDAVVYLGADHTIQEPDTEVLNRLLLRSGPASSLAGRSFLDLFASAERDRVQACLEAEQAEATQEHVTPSSRGSFPCQSSNASLLHTHLQDSSSAKVPVQLFLASIRDLDETLQIVGVKEVGDDMGPVQQRFPPRPVRFAPGYENDAIDLDVSAAALQSGEGEQTAVSSETSSESNCDDMILCFSVPSLTIASTTESFDHLVRGPHPVSNFGDLFAHRQDFEAWIRGLFDNLGISGESSVQETGVFELCVRRSRSRFVKYRVRLRVFCCKRSDLPEPFESDFGAVDVTITECTAIGRHRVSQSSASSSRGTPASASSSRFVVSL